MPSTRRATHVRLLVATLLAALALTGCKVGSPSGSPTGTAGATGGASVSNEQQAVAALLTGVSTKQQSDAENALNRLRVNPASTMKGYDRDAKFPHWLDADTNGWKDVPTNCDSREAALLRDGKKVVTTKKYCTVKSGTWIDPYTALPITDYKTIDMDHMVPLANAWRSGANTWTQSKRIAYANSPLVEVTTTYHQNRTKGDKGPEGWKPPNAKVQCAYAVRWIVVKETFGLMLVSEAERSALNLMLNTCNG